MKAPIERDVRKLFAKSLNQCAFPGCITPIVGLSEEMLGEICHINARNPDGPRYEPAQSDNERHGFGNLVLLCRNHHKTVDDYPEKYSADWLRRIKLEHEQNGNIELDPNDARLAKLLLAAYARSNGANVTNVSQVATGEYITQVAGDYHHHGAPQKPKIVVTPPLGSVSPAELKQIHEWINRLVEDTNMSRGSAYSMWWERFKNRFRLAKVEQLLSRDMSEAAGWYRQQSAILKQGMRTTAPNAWRNARYGAIHAAIKQMGVDKLEYYSTIATRLKMKKQFTSLTQLTKINLERVYTMVLRDARVVG